MSDTNVIIHIFPGEAVEKEGTFDDMRRRGLVEFKNYLLTVLGHVGISFPPEKKNLWIWTNYNTRTYNSFKR